MQALERALAQSIRTWTRTHAFLDLLRRRMSSPRLITLSRLAAGRAPCSLNRISELTLFAVESSSEVILTMFTFYSSIQRGA